MGNMRIVGIIGAGQMGSGIAQTVAQNGIKVLLCDIDIALAEKAKAGIDKALARLVSRDKITPTEAEAALSRITPVGDYAPMADADLIIEAATEKEEINARSSKRRQGAARRRDPGLKHQLDPDHPHGDQLARSGASSACTSSIRSR
jgi:3-hydroxyacyl-CoA dehydrogenase